MSKKFEDINSKINPYFAKAQEINLDKLLTIKENRNPNHLGLYRMNCLVVGKTGSGKTTTLLKLLLTDAIDDFRAIVFIIPQESLNSGFYKTLRNRPELLKGKEAFFIIIGEEDIPSISTLNKLSKEIQGPIAIVLDDFINAFTKNDWLIFKRYVTQLSRVQYGASLFALTQNLLEFSTTYRKNFNCFCLFVNSLTLLQFKEIVKSYYDFSDFTKEELEQLYNAFKSESHNPLWLINVSDRNKSMMFNGVYITPNDLFGNSPEIEESEDFFRSEKSDSSDSSDSDSD